jgi:hypothetical protein
MTTSHQGGLLGVVKNYYLVNDGGVKGSTTTTYSGLNYNLRAEWLVTYDAKDRTGNSAQQIVFALILNDKTAPVITPTVPSPTTLEACDRDNEYQDTGTSRQYWDLPNDNVCTDNFDLDDLMRSELQV